jgi:hypothetical protein
MSTRITVKSNGEETLYRTNAKTIGELFSDNEFLEDFGISPRAYPLLNGEQVGPGTELIEDIVVSSAIGASSKS